MSDSLSRIGRLVGTRHALYLGPGEPLSRMRVPDDGRWTSVSAALATARAEALRRRVAIRLDGGPGPISDALSNSLVSPVFPILDGDIALLDAEQIAALGRPLGDGGTVRVRHIDLPTYAFGGPEKVVRPYWLSTWTFADGPTDANWWRVWPQGSRQDVRELVASFSRHQYERLGRPGYIVVENPFAPGRYVYAAAREDTAGTALNSTAYSRTQTVALDASCRDALGIYDGEFCLVHKWSSAHAGRALRRRAIGARTVVAHSKTASRVDFEKLVCRLSQETMEAIGARPDDHVIVESVTRDEGRANELVARSVRLRVLPIAEGEATERALWERSAGTEGWVDPAALYALHPPMPAIYLDRFAREKLGIRLASPVVVRAHVWSRFWGEAGELAWVAVGGVFVALLTATHVSAWAAVVLTAALAAVFMAIRMRRAVR